MPDPREILSKALTLPSDQEMAFQTWAANNNVPLSNDYDMRGFYQALTNLDPRAVGSVNPNDQQMHFPDIWKMPNHQTFSTDSSFYNPQTMPTTPTWNGGEIGNGQQAWTLRRPDGQIVAAEGPWYGNGGFVRK